MKIIRLVSLLTAFVLAFVLLASSCKKQETSVVIPETITEETEKGAYSISSDLAIQAVYQKVSDSGFGKHLIVFVKNCADDTIIDYSIAYLGFDLNGNVTRLANTFGDTVYGEDKTTMANILPGDVYGLADGSTEGIYLGDADSAVRYVQAAVSHIKFKSGKEWEMGDVDAWTQDTIAAFSIEQEKNYLQSLKSDAEAAMDNPFLTITNTHSKQGPSYLDALDLECTFKNIGDKPIRSFSTIILEYEDGGKGVQLSNQSWKWNYQYITNNSRRLETELSLQPQEDFSGTASSALVSYCTDYLIIVDHIEFEDDTVWNNDCALQFMMYNESENQMQ